MYNNDYDDWFRRNSPQQAGDIAKTGGSIYENMPDPNGSPQTHSSPQPAVADPSPAKTSTGSAPTQPVAAPKPPDGSPPPSPTMPPPPPPPPPPPAGPPPAISGANPHKASMDAHYKRVQEEAATGPRKGLDPKLFGREAAQSYLREMNPNANLEYWHPDDINQLLRDTGYEQYANDGFTGRQGQYNPVNTQTRYYSKAPTFDPKEWAADWTEDDYLNQWGSAKDPWTGTARDIYGAPVSGINLDNLSPDQRQKYLAFIEGNRAKDRAAIEEFNKTKAHPWMEWSRDGDTKWLGGMWNGDPNDPDFLSAPQEVQRAVVQGFNSPEAQAQRAAAAAAGGASGGAAGGATGGDAAASQTYAGIANEATGQTDPMTGRLDQFANDWLDNYNPYNTDLVRSTREAGDARRDQFEKDSSRKISEWASSRGLLGSSLEGERVTDLQGELGRQRMEQERDLMKMLADGEAQGKQSAFAAGLGLTGQKAAQSLQSAELNLRAAMAGDQKAMQMLNYELDKWRALDASTLSREQLAMQKQQIAEGAKRWEAEFARQGIVISQQQANWMAEFEFQKKRHSDDMFYKNIDAMMRMYTNV
jgi:hypothetical protein